MIAVIGDRESILPFKAFGVAAFEAGKPSEAERIVTSIEPDKYEVVFVTEELVQGLKGLDVETDLNIVAIPGRKGSLGYGKLVLKNLIRKAIGAEVGE